MAPDALYCGACLAVGYGEPRPRDEATEASFDPARHPNSRIAGGRVTLNGNARVTSFVEGASTQGLVNAGVYLLEPGFATAIPPGFQDFGRDVLPGQLASGDVSGYLIDPAGYCLGLDTPESLRNAEELIATNQVALARSSPAHRFA